MLKWFNDKKTYIAGVGVICTGIGQVCTALAADYFDPQEVWAGIMVIAGGFGMCGFRHALAKNAAAPQSLPK